MDELDSAVVEMVTDMQEPHRRLTDEQGERLLQGHRTIREKEIVSELTYYRDQFLRPLIAHSDMIQEGAAAGDFLRFNPSGASPIQFSDSLTSSTKPLCAGGSRITQTDPTFELVSGEKVKQSSSGRVAISRAATAGTLEAATAAGHWWPGALEGTPTSRFFPGDDCLGLNEVNHIDATACTPITFPTDTRNRILEVAVEVELQVGGGSSSFPFPIYWGNFLHLLNSSSPDVGINGGSAAWGSMALTLYSPDGRTNSVTKIVGGYQTALNPGVPYVSGVLFPKFTITARAGIAPSHSTVMMMVDLEVFAAAQSTSADINQPFAAIEVLTKTTAGQGSPEFGIPSPSARFKIRRVTADICPLVTL